MPRKQRIRSANGIYHIIVRGINKQLIFEEDSDFKKFLSILKTVKTRTNLKVFAYCLLGNHVHLLLKEGNESVSDSMRRIGVMYVAYFNGKYERNGSLFQDRYASEPVDDNNYFKSVLIYILQNPVNAGIVQDPGKYAWSSFRDMFETHMLIDIKQLAEIVDINSIATSLRTSNEEGGNYLGERQRLRYSDTEARSLMKSVTRISNTSDFQSRSRDQQVLAVMMLRDALIPIRQLSRITGISKGVIEGWVRKNKVSADARR